MDEQISPLFAAPRSQKPVAWVTWTIAVSTVAVFLLQLEWLHRSGHDILGDTLAFSPESWSQHRYWTLITYAWVHAVAMFGDSSLFWLHIVANMLPLVCLGPALEELLGHVRYLAMYLGGAIAAALVWFLFVSQTEHFRPEDENGIIGASGAVFALIAAIGTAMPHQRVTVLLFYVLPLTMSMRLLALVACGTEAVQMVFHWMPEVAHSAHLGGAAFGFIYVLAIRQRSMQDDPAI